MTQQFSDILINKCRNLDLKDFKLIVVLTDIPKTGESTKQYLFSQQPIEKKLNVMFACWSGYLSKYKITAKGALFLVSFEYLALLPDRIEPDHANEQTKENFWLGLRSDSSKRNTYIPFVEGKLILNLLQWVSYPT